VILQSLAKTRRLELGTFKNPPHDIPDASYTLYSQPD
jgi:hypothetical protein